MKTKKLMAAVAVALTLCVTIGGTLAWLTDKTSEVKNTFTVGNIDIELDETTGSSYEMMPGSTLKKDPTVTVKAGSEACYLFVTVDEDDQDDAISYSIAGAWTKLEDGVYYIAVPDLSDASADMSFAVLDGSIVKVNENVTDETQQATLTFKAYAIQQANLTVNEAWNVVSK